MHKPRNPCAAPRGCRQSLQRARPPPPARGKGRQMGVPQTHQCLEVAIYKPGRRRPPAKPRAADIRGPGQEVGRGWSTAPAEFQDSKPGPARASPHSPETQTTRETKGPPRRPLRGGAHGVHQMRPSALAFTGTKPDTTGKQRRGENKSGSKNSILFLPLPPPPLPQYTFPLVPTATLQSEKNKFRGAGFGGEGLQVKTVKSQ